MRFRGFIGGSAVAQSVIADAEDTVNLYVEQLPSGGAEGPSALFPTPGFQQWSTVADVGSRGALWANGRLFFVIAGGLYEFDSNGTATKRGTVVVDQNPAQIIYNGVLPAQLGIASGGNIYSYNLTTNVLSAPLLTGGYTHLAFAAGFGLALNPTTGKVNLSAVNDLSTWPAGIFFQRSLFADPYQAMFVDASNLVWMLGTDSFEVRYNSGIGTQPFVPLSGLVGRSGIAAPFAYGLSALGNFWLARNAEGVGEFVATQGGIPQPASTNAFSTAVAGYLRTSRIDDAEVVTYQQEGHTFATISFPSAPASWAFDASGQNWARRGVWNPPFSRYDLWAPRVHVYAFGKHLIGDRQTGKVFWMDTTFTTEVDGSGIRRMRRSPHLNHEHQRLPIDQFEVLVDSGLGTVSGQGSDPQLMLRISSDGGRTWSNERRCGLGRIGEFRKRAYWTRLGAPADAVLEISYTDPAPLRIVDAFLNNAERAA